MRVVIAGGHGKTAMELTRLLAERGVEVRSLIRNPDHVAEVEAAGAAEAVVCDLEAAGDDEVARAAGEADAIVFAAGAGPGSGPARKETMDFGGVVKLLAAARRNRIPRFVVISSMGADPDREGEETFDVYLRAKGKADAAVRESGLDHLIVKPGMLTDDPPAGTVTAAESVERGEIARADVAAVIATLLVDWPGDRTIEIVGGDTPIEELAAQLAG
ncbi:MAG TPA: NAD(P)H-binding protein [Solirubrobacterales bacterium]|nr:NAD(P)H-binding protein [Solirubrobacterales bacterium]